jgi:hypothetical protein
MWISPESGQTWEQIGETVWKELTPEWRALDAQAERMLQPAPSPAPSREQNEEWPG